MTRTTIVVSPRERYGSVIQSLQSLFLTVPVEVPVVVVEGGSPAAVREGIRRLAEERPFTWIHRKYPLLPQEARNIGFAQVDTEFVVFTDNDMHYEARWLRHLEDNATRHRADLVAPLICIGPPVARRVHHAGGRLVVEGTPDRPHVTERHRLMNEPIEAVDANSAPVDNEIVEFHCFLARSDYIRRVGPLDERLVTREQIDFGLRAMVSGARVTFERDAVVTYMARTAFEEDDLGYLSFRWSDTRAAESLRVFTHTWGISTDAERVVRDWIRPHRVRAYASAFAQEAARLGDRAFQAIHVDTCDRIFELAANNLRNGAPAPKHPPPPDRAAVRAMFARRLYGPPHPGRIADPAAHVPFSPVVAGMATMPSRRETFERSVASILPQVHRLYLFLDRFEEMPRSFDDKIVALDSRVFGDLRANGKFLGLLFHQGGAYYASIDDDIEYPPDYVETMVGHVTALGNRGVVCVHGSVLDAEFQTYLNSRTIHTRTTALAANRVADIPGTCTTVFHTDRLWFDVRQWNERNMVDLRLAVECRSRNVPIYLVKRESGWIRELDWNQPDSIFRALCTDDSLQTQLARRLVALP